MKIKISYLEEEAQAASIDLEALRVHHPDAKIRKSDRHAPYKQIYLSIPSNRTIAKSLEK